MEIRKARQADLDGILDLVNGVFCRSNNKPETMGSQFPFLFSEHNANHLWVAVDNGKVVSHVGYFSTGAVIEGRPVKISSIGSVATDSSYRNLGLSTQLLNHAFESMKSEQTDIVLVSGARGLYKRNGYYSVGKAYQYVSGNKDDKHKDYQIKHIPKEELHDTTLIEELIELEGKESTRFVRSVEEFKALFSAAGYCRIFPWRQELYKIEQNGKMAAYFIVGFETKEAREIAHIIEFHGDRQALAAGLHQMSLQPSTDVLVPVLSHEIELINHLNEMGFTVQETQSYPGTVKLPNPVLFWSKFKALLTDFDQNSDLLEAGNSYHLQISGESVFEGSEEELAQWLFLRLPLPWPNGLNYI